MAHVHKPSIREAEGVKKNDKFKAKLSYIARTCLKTKQKPLNDKEHLPLYIKDKNRPWDDEITDTGLQRPG